jgi:ferredoxin
MYFSATGTTEKVVCQTAQKMAEIMKGVTPVNKIDFTLTVARKEAVSFTGEDLVVIGVPVYAGRVPNVLLKYLNDIAGHGALAVPVVLYGNRNYDDALIELKDILETRGFQVIAGGAFVGEHSFSKVLAANRPDEKDMAVIRDFADKVSVKITEGDTLQPVIVKGNTPYRPYYKPVNKNGIPVDIRKVSPKTHNDCTDCKLCVDVCPMGSIDYEDVSIVNGICIKCGACIKKCPAQAKYYDDEDYLRHKHELEIDFSRRKEPEIFV